MHDVQRLALFRVLAIDLRARLELFLRRHLLVMIDAMNFLRDVRQDERIVIIRGHEVHTAIGEMDRVALLIEHVEKILFRIAILLLRRRQLSVGEMLQLLLLHELLDAGPTS